MPTAQHLTKGVYQPHKFHQFSSSSKILLIIDTGGLATIIITSCNINYKTVLLVSHKYSLTPI